MNTTLICLLTFFHSHQKLDRLLINIQSELIFVLTDDDLQHVIYREENDPLYAALIRYPATAAYTISSLDSRISYNSIEVCKAKRIILPVIRKIKSQSRKVERIYECIPDDPGYYVWRGRPSTTLIETIDNIHNTCR